MRELGDDAETGEQPERGGETARGESVERQKAPGGETHSVAVTNAFNFSC